MKLTSREKEIAEVLKKEPLISQDDLALQFGISRSSVAVHISNLMKKGIILGKGYVFNKKVSIVVVGQVYVEIKVREDADNTFIDMRSTGFASEVGKAIAAFGIQPKLITVVGNDDWGNQILDDLKKLEVDIANIYRHPDKRTCKKIVSNRGLYIEESYKQTEYLQAIEAREWVAFNCDWLVVEPEFLNYIIERFNSREDKAPCFCGCWYADKGIPAYLKDYGLLVLGVADLRSDDSYVDKGQEFVAAGMKECIITDGSTNMIWIDAEGIDDFSLLPNQTFNTPTTMHLFLAGLVYGLSNGYSKRQAMRIACATAHAAVKG